MNDYDYVENIYIENTRCYKIIGKSIEKHELYVLNPYVEEHLVGTFISYEDAMYVMSPSKNK